MLSAITEPTLHRLPGIGGVVATLERQGHPAEWAARSLTTIPIGDRIVVPYAARERLRAA